MPMDRKNAPSIIQRMRAGILKAGGKKIEVTFVSQKAQKNAPQSLKEGGGVAQGLGGWLW